MAELERIKRQRANQRGQVTRLIQTLHTLFDEGSVTDVREKNETLTKKGKKLVEMDTLVQSLMPLEELDDDMNAAAEYESNIFSMQFKCKQLVDQHVENGFNTKTARLPMLEIAKYGGDPLKWQTFWDLFESSIHGRTDLTSVEKFSYLRSLLTGNAATAIEGILTTKANYETAIQLLKERFGRTELIINMHLSNLLNLQPVKNPNDVIALRKLYDFCEIQVRGLETLGINENGYSQLLYPLLLRSIPERVAVEWGRSSSTKDVKGLMSFIKKELENHELIRLLAGASHISPSNVTGKFQKNFQLKNDKFTSTASTLMAQATSVPSDSVGKPECLFCNGNHKEEKCNKTVAQKKEALKRKGICFKCLGARHIARFCRENIPNCKICSISHHALLCEGPRKQQEVETRTNVTEASSVVSTLCMSEMKLNYVFLQTAQAQVMGTEGCLDSVLCLLDGGSQKSFIRESISRRLRLKRVGKQLISMNVFGSKKSVHRLVWQVEVPLKSIHSNKTVTITALECPELCADLRPIPDGPWTTQLKQKGFVLADDPLSESRSHEVAVLIGGDNYWRVTMDKQERVGEALRAIETIFGWTLHGSAMGVSQDKNSDLVLNVSVNASCSPDDVSSQLRSFWELEHLGLKPEEAKLTQDEKKAEELLSSSIRFKEGRYEVALLWRDDAPSLPNNFQVAKRRLQSTISKISRDDVLAKRYNDAIQQYIDSGIAEIITDGAQSDFTYYMPHLEVIREDKTTTKFRIVFDASSHEKGKPSLNDLLLPGPNLYPDLGQVLLRFRTYAVAITADLEKAFLQIALREEDRDSCRFLWIDNFEKQNLILYRITRVLFGITSSPFLLAGTIRAHLKTCAEEFPETTSIIQDALYVDDLISGADDEESAFRVSQEACHIFKRAGMNMQKWSSNSENLEKRWTNEKFQTSDEIMGRHIFKVLGLSWDKVSDVFVFDLKNIINFLPKAEMTKRGILKTVARIFDPLGLISPFVIRVKCFIQDLWEYGLPWDDPLTVELQFKWKEWCSELSDFKNLRIPRNVAVKTGIHQIHIFCDASERAYGAVVYLRTENAGKVKISLLMAKTRVAPLKRNTIPRLELIAAVIGSRLRKYVQESLNLAVDSIYMWTDSMICFYWIRGKAANWKPFVSNRVSEIQTHSEPDEWRHCRGVENPADLLTRGMKANDLIQSNLWWHGPPWLRLDQKMWPQSQQKLNQNELSEIEETKRKTNLVSAVLVDRIESTIDLSKYSKLKRGIRVLAWVRRFIANLKGTRQEGSLTAEELEEAERVLILDAQKDFAEELKLIRAGNRNFQSSSKIRDLNPFIDEKGILRVGGRLHKSALTEEQKHPIILPTKHRFTTLLIMQAHERLFHHGVRDVCVEIRERFWVLKARQIVKTTLKSCLVCRKFKVKGAEEVAAPLPADRLKESPPFEVTGVDFAGPLITRNKGVKNKSYIVLFTCAVTRAIHLELVSDMTTRTFMLSFRRFIARRGVCRTIYSDNARTFKRANKDLQELYKSIRSNEVRTFFGDQGITWKFIVERAAWWGGWWERMVQSVKRCLQKVLGKAFLNFEEMLTVLTEIESVINSRPLTYVSSDQNDEPLTPAHFLIGKRLSSLPPGRIKEPDKVKPKDLQRRWRYRQLLIDGFWRRWTTEYVMNLKSLHQVKNVNSNELKVGDLVLIQETNLPRLLWKTGRVTEAHVGRDQRVRSCTVRLPNRQSLKRPIQLLCPLELN